MNRFELFEKYRGKLPFVYGEINGFRNSIRKLLEEYLTDINGMDDCLYIGFKKDLKVYVEGIKNVIDLSYQGAHSEAFGLFKELMDKHRLSVHLKEEISSIEDTFFYRMRVVENRASISFKEMFHIPLDKRGIIRTQRYSFPGYPCLYLGTSVNACWEELHRPLLDNCMISALQLLRVVKFIDLSLPNKDDIIDSTLKLERFIMSYPLMLACSVKVLNYSDPYKPEYIVPQLLMEYIINRNIKKELYNEWIFGILYTSVHINNDFKFSDKEFINWAIPVLEPLSNSKYCPVLCEIFKITQPTCEEFERIKTGRVTYLYNDPSSIYEESTFFKLESRLKNRELFKVE